MKELIEMLGKNKSAGAAFMLGGMLAITATTKVLDRMVEARAKEQVAHADLEYVPRPELESRFKAVDEKVVKSVDALAEQIKAQAAAIDKLSDRVFDMARQQPQNRRATYTF